MEKWEAQLAHGRSQIDRIDDVALDLTALLTRTRLHVVEHYIIPAKIAGRQDAYQQNRENEIRERLELRAIELGLPVTAADNWLDLQHMLSVNLQQQAGGLPLQTKKA